MKKQIIKIITILIILLVIVMIIYKFSIDKNNKIIITNNNWLFVEDLNYWWGQDIQ